MPRKSLRSRRRRATVQTPSPLMRLWLIRILVPLGGYVEWFSQSFMFDATNRVESAIGLTEDTCDNLASFSDREHVKLLRKLHAKAEKELTKAALPVTLADNCARIAALLGLNAVAQKILAFAVLLHRDALLQEVADHLGDVSIAQVHRVLSVVLDEPEAVIREALAPASALIQSGLVDIKDDRTYFDSKLRIKMDVLNPAFAERMLSSTEAPMSLFRDSIIPAPPAELTLKDFEHVPSLGEIVLPLLRAALDAGRPGVNILLYGQPGTGKSQCTRALAASLNTNVYQVSSEDGDGDPIGGEKRLRAYRAAQCVVARSKTLLVFDEAEDVFSAGHGIFFFSPPSAAQQNKAWVNRTLESNPMPCLWLTNSIRGIDPAFIRRFDVVVELPIPPLRQRARMIESVCGGLVTPAGIRCLAQSEHLAPAVVARAARVARMIVPQPEPAQTGVIIEQLINQTLMAQGHAALPASTARNALVDYDPACINTDTDLNALAQGIARTQQARLCLYGPPGTGKSAFAQWLAEGLDRPLMIRRVSDLIGPYVGESERNLAEAFHQARQSAAVFLLDEVDSFLHDRRQAQRSWEVTLVNEMLTQVEAFDGVFIAATNLMDNLDPAALRRFDLKLYFGYLQSGQAWQLLLEHAAALDLPGPDAGHQTALARLTALTPGDFAAVARQARFRPLADISAFIAALAAECAVKPDGPRRAIGFV